MIRSGPRLQQKSFCGWQLMRLKPSPHRMNRDTQIQPSVAHIYKHDSLCEGSKLSTVKFITTLTILHPEEFYDLRSSFSFRLTFLLADCETTKPTYKNINHHFSSFVLDAHWTRLTLLRGMLEVKLNQTWIDTELQVWSLSSRFGSSPSPMCQT